MKGKPPIEYFYHDGTRYSVTGDDRLAMSHFHEINNYKLGLRRSNVNNLAQVTGIKYFMDGTEAHVLFDHGMEKIDIIAPIIEPVPEPREIPMEIIIPCFVVTGDERYSSEVKGFIACLSGTFEGPYQFFKRIEKDEEVVLEGFYHEGFEIYDEELAFDHRKILSKLDNEIDGTLYYHKPSGKAPDEERAADGPEFGGWTQTFTCSQTYCYEDAVGDDGMMAISIFDVGVGGGGTQYGWQLQFDGGDICLAYGETPTFGGHYQCKHSIVLVVSAEEPPDMDDVQAQIDAWVETHRGLTIEDCGYLHENTITFTDTQHVVNNFGSFLDSAVNDSLRVNDEGVIYSTYLLEMSQQETFQTTWNDRTWQEEEYGSTMCDGCYTLEQTWMNELMFVLNDGDKHSVTNFFEWDYHYKYRGVYGLGIVYHRPDSGEALGLSSVFAGPSDGSYTNIGFSYLGPREAPLKGSVTFPIVPDGIDRYVIIPDVINMPDSSELEGKVRGHIFLGLIQKTIAE